MKLVPELWTQSGVSCVTGPDVEGAELVLDFGSTELRSNLESTAAA